MRSTIAVVVFSALVAVVTGFQVALPAAMRWGMLTWGGRFPGRLPAAMRVVAIVTAVVLVGFAVVLAIRAGMLLPEWQPTSRLLIWVVVGYCALGVIANAVTPSKWKRRVWLPVVLAMLLSSLVAVLS